MSKLSEKYVVIRAKIAAPTETVEEGVKNVPVKQINAAIKEFEALLKDVPNLAEDSTEVFAASLTINLVISELKCAKASPCNSPLNSLESPLVTKFRAIRAKIVDKNENLQPAIKRVPTARLDAALKEFKELLENVDTLAESILEIEPATRTIQRTINKLKHEITSRINVEEFLQWSKDILDTPKDKSADDIRELLNRYKKFGNSNEELITVLQDRIKDLEATSYARNVAKTIGAKIMASEKYILCFTDVGNIVTVAVALRNEKDVSNNSEGANLAAKRYVDCERVILRNDTGDTTIAFLQSMFQ